MSTSCPTTSSASSELAHLAATDLAQHKSGPKVSENMARFIEKQSTEIVPRVFQDLTQRGKTILVEVACSPESRLSAEIQRLTGDPEAAVRCSHWNGCDLGTSGGVKQVLHTIDVKQPRHVWISPECGPYSPLQAINQRTSQQIQELEEKRKKVLKQYVGASCVYIYCIQRGIHVTWEWAQRCQGWRLPLIQRLVKKYELYFGITQGCRVGLRDPKTQNLLHKGWKLMSTCRKMSDTMNMPCLCPKGYTHARCEGGLAGLSAYYTEEFVRKVATVMLLDITTGMVHDEMKGKTVLPQMFGEGLACVCSELKDHDSNLVCGFCAGGHDNMVLEHACVNHLDFSKRREDIQRKLYLLHAATGHCSVRNMVQALERRHASKEVIDAAKEFTCSICQEKQRINTKHVASLEPLPPKFATVSADGGKWIHPKTQEECEFACIIDEGSRYRVARVLKHGKRQTMNASQFLQYFREGWMQYFGCPSTLRLDPAGAFRSHELERFCDDHSIFLDVVPGEAHWLLGTCEQAVQGLKTVMYKMAEEDPDITAESALAEAVKVFNHRELVRGFSPIQHVLGKAPDETGRFIQSLTQTIPDEPIANPNEEFKDSVERMRQAEKALADWQAQQKIVKAMNSRGQRLMDYRPGDLVFYWRKQIAGERVHKNGRFLGPARILATETKREQDGSLRKGSAVWCVRGRRLVKCSVEQLRPASKREELLEHLGSDEDSKVPWTFPRVVQELGGNEYEDVTAEIPDDEDWHTAQDPMLVEPPVIRHRYKRSVADTLVDRAHDTLEGTSRQRTSEPRGASSSTDMDQAWWNLLEEPVPETTQGSVFWAQETAAVEVEIPLPESRRALKKMCEDLEGFFVGALKRRAVEVHEKHLSEAERKQFAEAKSIEVRNFIAARAFEALPPELQPDRSQAIGMRWLLTWKLKEDGGRKAKARAILQGYQDPHYEHRATTTPVMTRQTRQFLLHEASRNGWSVRKGDVTGAFLQGREYPQKLYCTPCPEICKEMGLEPGEIMRVKRGCYGLVDAPLEWYRSISEYLLEIGLVKSWADPCCWFWKPNNELKGMIAGHVDDFLFAGPKDDPEWIALEKKIQEKYKWSEWEEGSFTQCGVLIECKDDGSFHLSQPAYLEKISEINLSSSRRKDTNAVTSEQEKTALRAVLGALSWHAQQVAPHYSAEVGLLLSDVTVSTVETIHQTNKLLQRAKMRRNHKLIVHAHPKEVPLGLFCWADAAGQNRRDGGSTQGIFVGVAPLTLLQGSMEKVTPISWHAGKIDRVTRSPGAAEARAVVNGEDMLYHARYQYGEMLQSCPNVFEITDTVNIIPGCIISDSRNVYDKLQCEEISAKGAERRTDIELLSVKASQKQTKLIVRWVHSEAQLGNALTKAQAKELEMYYTMGGCWKIVEDDQMRSARKRRSEGIPALNNEKPNTSDSTPKETPES